MNRANNQEKWVSIDYSIVKKQNTQKLYIAMGSLLISMGIFQRKKKANRERNTDALIHFDEIF